MVGLDPEPKGRPGFLADQVVDEAEGFLLDHALFSPPRRWPPLAPEETQSARLQSKAKKMDWEDEARRAPMGEDDPMDGAHHHSPAAEGESNKERCVICLMELRDRTIVGVCGHEFCFECIGVWANQSRRCPLCSADMAPFLLHDLDNPVPTKFYLPPLPTRQITSFNLPGPSRRVAERPHPAFEKTEPDELDLQIERRKEIYQHGLYCKHIGSNAQTRYRPNPTPHEIANSPQLIQRTTAFLRRELRVWSHADAEYLTSHILSLIKAVDIRSDVAIRLLAEFLDPPAVQGRASSSAPGIPNGPEHFAHELYSWLRSPFKELRQWDLVAQYDSPDAEEEPEQDRDLPAEKERSRSISPEDQPPKKRSRSRSVSPSPSLSSRSYSYSSRSRSRSRYRSESSYSRSPSPRPKRDSYKRDRSPPRHSPSRRAWNEADHWVDPDILAERAERQRRIEERMERKRIERAAEVQPWTGRGMRPWGAPVVPKERIELLPDKPDPPVTALRAEVEEAAQNALSIKGAAVVPNRRLTLKERLAVARGEPIPADAEPAPAPVPQSPFLTLKERLAKAKAEALGLAQTPLPENPAEITAEDLLETSPTAPSAPRRSISGLKETVRARLRLRLKLESERANFRHNIAESRAQELRRQLLEAKVTRQAAETDAVLRRMDRLDWQKEVRRRLMVEKMLQAETEGEKRARELKEKLSAEKRRKMLREVLLARKRASVVGDVEGEDGAAMI
ncbi:uncharacterized protein MKK02DRAFT_30074 [Dioszegia hungarica]|uniref:RING-type E3 ubiquitin transferase n=1 Tax=Dioszegia hungarica TaxID=4972 RepID=A0AA38H3Y2_9TREE|nr:uncharacterized protein MKK02DRAFT_30074 [Dioszegia hungarica]KAI9632201.1 hypothetical protein MKK02DRAFT_30074 [Dioszegia hungarica]